MDLVKIESPAFLKTLSLKELESLASEIREFMISSISKTGGYLAANLSSVELTISLHKVFDSPKDKILFDAIHQSLTHKILTGRSSDLNTLRQLNGLSSYQSINESRHDPFSASSVGQALSIGYGLSMKNDADEIICVLNNESLSHGEVYEALNHISSTGKKIIIVINDCGSEKSINAIATSLKNLTLAKPITQFKDDMSSFFEKGNVITGPIKRSIKTITTSIGKTVGTNNLFTEMGLKYVGPFDGHKVNDVIRVLNYAKTVDEPIVVHFKTIKGKGYKAAQNEHEGLWVDLNDFDMFKGQHSINLPNGHISIEDDLFDEIKHLSENYPKLVVVNTISAHQNQLSFLKERLYLLEPTLHALSFSSGLSLAGYRVILLVDASMIIKGMDNLLSEIGFMDQNITIVGLNSGLILLDGGYQKGLFDLALSYKVPTLNIVTGRNHSETRMLLSLSVSQNHPTYLRVQTSSASKQNFLAPNFEFGQWEMLNLEAKECRGIVLTYGKTVDVLFEKIKSNQLPLWVVNMRHLKPLDEKTLHYCFSFGKPIFFVSEDYRQTDLLCQINEFKEKFNYLSVIRSYGIAEGYYTHGHVNMIRKSAGIDSVTILKNLVNDLEVD